MQEKEYRQIYEKLESPEDVDRLVHKDYERDFLFVVYTLKVIRDTKKRYYSVKKKAPELLMDWRLGASFLELSLELGFPPVLTASILMQQRGWSKNRFSKAVREPSIIDNQRIKAELKEVIDADLIYSPKGNQIQFERGREVEDRIGRWVKAKNIKHITEKEAKKRGHIKTPDFLLEAPLKVNGHWVNWIESKASFGDRDEIKKDYRKQLTHYVDLFGAGMVCYWYGFIEGILDDERIIVKDKEFFER
ncbi:MAG: hypothetical protein GF334_02160 [Candidatus Altiarchaeales archaeon]|nr:hypothetical protein [Candidatus Altiarchaeales archaeon]